jgi:hypothetical protein
MSNVIYELMLIMDQLFLILISEYNTEDQVSREIDLDTMVSLSEWYYPEFVNRDTNLKSIEIDISWSATYWKVYCITYGNPLKHTNHYNGTGE